MDIKKWWKKCAVEKSWWCKDLRREIIIAIIDEIYYGNETTKQLREAHQEVIEMLMIMRYRDQYITTRSEFDEYSQYNDNKFEVLIY